PFARSFEEHYVPMFERLLSADLPMVIYVDPKHADIVWRRRRRHNTRVVPLTAEALRSFQHFDRIQEIRGRAGWYSQTGWLPWSPQAALEYYNPLVMSKMRWLSDQAKENPFGTEHLFWADAGLCQTVGDDIFRESWFAERLADVAGDFLFLGFPYVGSSEIHGFPREALTQAAHVDKVDRVTRGGFFGGRAPAVTEVAALYEGVLGETLTAGHMGTEESVFTILSYRYPERFRCYMVAENGLLGTFFQALRDGDVKRLLLRPSKTDEREPHTLPAGVAAVDPEGVEKGTTTFLGLRMMQNSNVGFALQELTRHLAADGGRVARIIL